MKKRVSRNLKILVIIFVLILSPNTYTLNPSYAATPTPSPAPSQNEVPKDSADLERIQKIKDIVASKVAELNLVEKRGIIGTVSEVANMKIVIKDVKGSTRNIDVDELTKFSIDKKESDISDLEKGTTYSFVGLYNKDTQRLLARSVSTVDSIPTHFEGAILEIDEKKFRLVVVNSKGDKKNVDIENSTKTNLATADGDLIRSGFSKLEVNKRILIVGFVDEDDSNLISATRIIHFEDVPPSKEMQSHVDLPSPTPED